MPISAVKYPSINAKLKGMYAKRLKNDDLLELSKQNNLKSAVAILKNKDTNFKTIDENADREQIGKLLNLEIIYDIEKIVKYLNKNDKKTFEILISRYEIECIKNSIKLVYSQKNFDESIKVWTENIFENLKGLESVKNTNEILKIVDKAKYKKILKKHFNNDEENFNIFDIENELDKLYLKNLYNSAGNKKLEKMIGTKIDFMNILWIYRMKRYYKFPEEKIKESIIDINYFLKKSEITSLIKATNLDEMNEVLKNTVYLKLVSTDIYDLECKTKKYLQKLYIKNFKSNLLSINCVYAYLNLVELENSDIISIIEAVRYGIDKSRILKKLLV